MDYSKSLFTPYLNLPNANDLYNNFDWRSLSIDYYNCVVRSNYKDLYGTICT